MVSERDRILNIIKYIETFGISVNIGKNRAQGNKGFFKAKDNTYRIDISKGLDNENIISTLCHEFSHFIHYINDNKLKSLDFFFDNFDENLQNELIEITIDSIPKNNIKPLFDLKEKIKNDIEILNKKLNAKVADFSLSKGSLTLEKNINKTPYKYLLKHDRIQIINFFSKKCYSIENLEPNLNISETEINYLIFKSKQRALKRINSKISRLNRYYNSPTELFARSIELYIMNNEKFETKTPLLYKKISEVINSNKIPELSTFVEIAKNKS